MAHVQAQFDSQPNTQGRTPFYANMAHPHQSCPVVNSFTPQELLELESAGFVPYIFDTGANASVVPGPKGVVDQEPLSGTLSGVGAIPIIGTGTLELHVSKNLHANSSFQDVMHDQSDTVVVPIHNVLIAPKLRTKRLISASSLYDMGYYCHTDVNTGRFYLAHNGTGHVIPIIQCGGLYFVLARYHAVPNTATVATFDVPTALLVLWHSQCHFQL